MPPSTLTPLAPLSDGHLMLLVKGGDVGAFEALVRRHRSAATSLARHLFGPDLAEDAVQAALVALWQHRASYRAERGTPRSWLLGIVHHRGVDLVRSRASRQRHMVSMDHAGWAWLADTTPSSEPVHVQLERAETQAEVRRLVAALPPAQRTVIEMAYFGALSQQEIADRLALPLGTVKGRMRLGIEKLRAAWKRREALDSHRALIAVWS
jgi:RNA polymerase sigma-70 factor (ECF subfamily)